MQPAWLHLLRIVDLYTTQGHTLVINHLKAANMTRLSPIIQVLKYIWGFILERDEFIAVSEIRLSYKNALLKHIWWFIQEISHINVAGVVRLLQIIPLLKNIKGFIMGRNLMNAISAIRHLHEVVFCIFTCIRIHTNEKQHKCSFCDNIFSNNKCLINHICLLYR